MTVVARSLFAMLASARAQSLRLQKFDDLLPRRRVCDAVERLHNVALNHAVRIGDELVERAVIPRQIRLLHRWRIIEPLQSTGFPSDDTVQARAQPVIAFLPGMARAAVVVEQLLARSLIGGEGSL